MASSVSPIGKESLRPFDALPQKSLPETFPVDFHASTTTEKEQQGIKQLRDNLGELLTARYTDIRLCRFMRARDHNISASEDMLRKEMKWREETKPDKIFLELPNDPEFKKLKTYWPGDFHGVDRFGVPMIIERLAAVDTTSLFGSSNHDMLIKFHIYCM